jgi:O-antigen chain-terminating methyltransferase
LKITKVAQLPQYLRALRAELSSLQVRVEGLAQKQNHQTKQYDKFDKRSDSIEHHLNQLMERLGELEHMVAVASRQKPKTSNAASDAPAESADLFADNHLLDKYYLKFEDVFRGTEEDVKKKQEPYVKLFKTNKIDYKKFPVVDLGCGRGEFIELLKKGGVRGIGVDLNESMVKRMKEKGYEAVHDNAINYIANAKSNSLGGITGFHFAEHIQFEQLIFVIAEACRALTPGGLLLLETPNPENLSVGAFTFHYDPSHLKPIPPAIIEFTAKYKGFGRTEIIRSQPVLTPAQIKSTTSNKQLQDLLNKVYGPRDYALAAYK